MDDQWTRRVWPPQSEEADRGAADLGAAQAGSTQVEQDLPPSARWYGTPAPPPRRRAPRWVVRAVVGFLALAAATAVIAALTLLILNRDEPVPVTRVTDSLAGVTYTLPPGWSEGPVAPVTGFTSVAARSDLATVMARPGVVVPATDLRGALLDLSELYGRLLLHGDKVDVVDDRAMPGGGWTRAVRAEYRDVVNQPAYLRVTLLTRPDGHTVMLLGLAHPDQPGLRTEVDQVMAGAK
ncbi:hypothetical protein J5X84_00450 [Streptosporangiaceae bacterium NEAU-GS5]|nr:hypothetical protein [Streptosporangiaceae bacterium NEAU-GS5]